MEYIQENEHIKAYFQFPKRKTTIYFSTRVACITYCLFV